MQYYKTTYCITLGFTDVRIHWETSFEPTLASSKNVVEETVMEAVRNAELTLELDQLLFREVKLVLIDGIDYVIAHLIDLNPSKAL